jgi:hypothetical protein
MTAHREHAASLTWALTSVNLHKNGAAYCAEYRRLALDGALAPMLLSFHMKPTVGFFFYAFYFYGTGRPTPLLALE